jgi:predicted RNase H-like HicB family nuclease
MNEDLRQWLRQRWVDISRKKKDGGHPACGASADKGVRAKDSSRKYPKCVPANKAKNMSKKQKKSAVTRKRRAPNEPGSPDNVKTDVKKESWEKWKASKKGVYSHGVPSNNAPENPEKMGGAIAFEKSREEVLAQLKEYIQHLIKEATVIPGIFRKGKLAVSEPTDPTKQNLERLFKSGTFTDDDIREITEVLYNLLTNNEIAKYADTIENLPNIDKFNSLVNKLTYPKVAPSIPREEKENIKKIIGKVSNTIDIELEKRSAEKMRSAEKEPSTGVKTSSSPKQQTVDVTKTVEVLKSQEVQDAIKGYIEKLQAAGVASPEISKKIADLGGMIDPNYPTALAASTINGLDPRYLGPPKITPEEQSVFQKVKGYFGLNEAQTYAVIKRYNIRNENDVHNLMENVLMKVLKESK